MELRVEEGDIIYCHKDLIMQFTGVINAIKGHSYKINHTTRNLFFFKNENNRQHGFENEIESYCEWFTLVPKEIKEEVEFTDFFDFN